MFKRISLIFIVACSGLLSWHGISSAPLPFEHSSATQDMKDENISLLLDTPILFLATTDAVRARAFYADTLGLTFVADEQYALVFDVAGTTLRIQKVRAVPQAMYTALGWHVDDIHHAVKTLTARGVKFERYPQLSQDEYGVWAVPGGGASVAWFRDPDGNTVSLSAD